MAIAIPKKLPIHHPNAPATDEMIMTKKNPIAKVGINYENYKVKGLFRFRVTTLLDELPL